MNIEHLPKPEGAWHDATCPEGPDCRSRDEHVLGITIGPVLRRFLEEYMPGAIARHNEYQQERGYAVVKLGDIADVPRWGNT